jgi:hypothetical protein
MRSVLNIFALVEIGRRPFTTPQMKRITRDQTTRALVWPGLVRTRSLASRSDLRTDDGWSECQGGKRDERLSLLQLNPKPSVVVDEIGRFAMSVLFSLKRPNWLRSQFVCMPSMAPVTG